MGLFNSRSAAALSWLLMSLALLHVQAQPSRYARRRGPYRGRRIGQPRSMVEAPTLPHLPFPVPITLLGGGAKLLFPPPPKEFAHANFLPTTEPLDSTSGVIKIHFSKNEVDSALDVLDNSVDQEKKIANFETTTATTTTTNSGQNSHFIVVPDVMLPLETEVPLNIPKALTSNIGQLNEFDDTNNSIQELTTFSLIEEFMTVKQDDIVLINSELLKTLEINTPSLNVSDLSPKFNITVDSEAEKDLEINVTNPDISVLSSNINSTLSSESHFALEDIVKSDPIDTNVLEVLPFFSENPDSFNQELLQISSNETEPESVEDPNTLLEVSGEEDHSDSFKVSDLLSSITVNPIFSFQSSFEGDILPITSETGDVPVTDTLEEVFTEISEQESPITETSISFTNLTTIEPQPFKRSNQVNRYQPVWVIHDFDSTKNALSKESVSSVSHHTWRNPTWH
ncbi:unnamed protein product [Meganyctiphanes norvegica]|uniref:Uncharacterized protein n=1 Tax=Meganyctiphanes norvegica TaxID=48144 RepID=A0AAV2Q667_MEGNR